MHYILGTALGVLMSYLFGAYLTWDYLWFAKIDDYSLPERFLLLMWSLPVISLSALATERLIKRGKL